MTKQLKIYWEWLESLGYSPAVWLGGDWHQPMHLLSKLLATELSERRSIDSSADVSFKVGYDSMTRLAEDTLGVPNLITERDLMIQYPNIFLSQLLYLICLKHSVDHIDPKTISSIHAPRLVFEARNGMDAQFPRCPSCHEHVFFVERLLIESSVWHRRCFKCVDCNALMRTGGFKKTKAGYECTIHAVRKILDEKEPARSPRPKVAPPPVPSEVKIEVDTPQSDDALSIASKRSSVTSEGEVRKKPVPPPKPKNLCSPKPPPTIDEVASCSEDSSVSSTMDQLSINSYETINDVNVKPEQPVPKLRVLPHEQPSNDPPVAPPRPKRASVLLTTGMTPPLTPSTSRTSTLRSISPSIAPRPNPRTLCTQPAKSSEEYPDDLCPFGDDEADLQVNFDYDESKNPFADSDDDEDSAPVPAVRTSISASVLPGESDRPKITPPPPPPTDMSTLSKVSPMSDDMKLRTLRLSKKKKRAPLPPSLVHRRTIAFTEHDQLEDTPTIAARVEKLDEEISNVEREGKKLELELLFLITTNPKDWYKLPRTEEYISSVVRLLDTLREQSYLQYTWREAFLNEIHSETEYLLRCLVEKDSQDEYSCTREKQLTSLLIFIIDEKAKLTESLLGDDSQRRDSSVSRKEHKKKTLRLRIAVLSKKLKAKKAKK